VSTKKVSIDLLNIYFSTDSIFRSQFLERLPVDAGLAVAVARGVPRQRPLGERVAVAAHAVLALALPGQVGRRDQVALGERRQLLHARRADL